MSVIGNLVVGFLTSLVIISASLLYHVKMPLMWMAIDAFIFTLIREIIKDLEDLPGDLKFKLNTLPLNIGIRATKKIVFGFYVSAYLATLLPVFIHYKLLNIIELDYLFITILIVHLPMFYLIAKLMQSIKPKDFSLQSKLLKLLILTGLISIHFLS